MTPPEKTTRLELVEYYPSTRGEEIKHKAGADYLGVIERASDGFTALSLGTPSGSRAHNIEVGQVYAITVAGRRHVLDTPWDRWRIRAAEIRQVVEGTLEDWAKPYFEPASPSFYRRDPRYQDQTDSDADRKHRRLIMGDATKPAKSSPRREPAEATGCALPLAVLFGAAALATGGMAAFAQMMV